jgi:hypothetical protein
VANKKRAANLVEANSCKATVSDLEGVAHTVSGTVATFHEKRPHSDCKPRRDDKKRKGFRRYFLSRRARETYDSRQFPQRRAHTDALFTGT